MRKIIKIIVPIAILFIFISISAMSSFHESLTYDEVVNIQEGKNAWINHTYNIELYHPPLAKVIQSSPVILLENGLHMKLSPIYEKNIERMMVVLMGVALLLSVFFVTNKFFGYSAAVLSLSLLAFEPNTLAFSHIINTDAMVNLMIFVSYFLLILLLQKSTKKRFILFAISVGLGLSSKMSFDSFFVLSAFALVIYMKRWNTIRFLMQKKYHLITLFVISLFIIWSSYFFHMSVIVKERKDSNRFSARLMRYAKMHNQKMVVDVLGILETQKVPLGDYIALYKNVALAKASPKCFFLGNFYPKCYWYFMPVTFLLKTPIPFILFTIIGIIALFTIKKEKEKYFYFLIPFAVIFLQAATSGAFPLNRYMLPMYPFAAIIGSYSLVFITKKWLVLIGAMLLIWYIYSFYALYPHYISYANELTGPKNVRTFRFWDSNSDWGQSLSDVYPYVKENNVGTLYLSYYGRDNGDLYGLKSDKAYGSYKFPEICEFHKIHLSNLKKEITLISLSNWYACGYSKMSKYKTPKGIVSDSFLIF